MELVLRQGRWAAEDARRRAGRPRLVRALEWALPWGARLRGGYFHAGVERAACRVIHRAARRGVLYQFAPPPPLRAVAAGGGGRVSEYRFRSPFTSHIPERNEATVRHYRCGALRRPLVIWNHGTGSFARLLERLFVARLLAAGVDVAVPVAPGFEGRRGMRGLGRRWAATVGSALSAIVQLVHDNVAVESWARACGYRTVAVSGIGIGGTVAAVLGATTARFDACVPMLAGAHPGRLWLPPRALARAVSRRALARAGLRRARTLVRLFDPVAPERLPPPRRRRHCAIVGLGFDTLVPAADVRGLALHWRVPPLWLPRCHVELPACAADLAAIVARATWAAA